MTGHRQEGGKQQQHEEAARAAQRPGVLCIMIRSSSKDETTITFGYVRTYLPTGHPALPACQPRRRSMMIMMISQSVSRRSRGPLGTMLLLAAYI